MLRSLHYAPYSVILGQGPDPSLEKDAGALEPWARRAYLSAGAAFLRAYLQEAAGAAFLPETTEEIQALVDAFLLEKAFYELAYELNHRPAWVRIPLVGLQEVLGL
jgi:predicted trehalose synthase